MERDARSSERRLSAGRARTIAPPDRRRRCDRMGAADGLCHSWRMVRGERPPRPPSNGRRSRGSGSRGTPAWTGTARSSALMTPRLWLRPHRTRSCGLVATRSSPPGRCRHPRKRVALASASCCARSMSEAPASRSTTSVSDQPIRQNRRHQWRHPWPALYPQPQPHPHQQAHLAPRHGRVRLQSRRSLQKAVLATQLSQKRKPRLRPSADCASPRS